MTPAFSHDMAEAGSVPPAEDPAPARDALGVEIVDATGRVAASDVAWLRDKVAEAARVLGCGGQFAARLIDDHEMSGAHDRFCGIAGTTDVLTFDLSDGVSVNDRGVRVVEADVLACVDEAARQASARGIMLRHELLLYLLHGILHCLGYDDHEDDAFTRMHTREDEVLRAIGVGDVFSLARRGQPGTGDAEKGVGGATGALGSGME